MEEKGTRVFPAYKWGERADHVRVTILAAGYDAVCLSFERCLLVWADGQAKARGRWAGELRRHVSPGGLRYDQSFKPESRRVFRY